MPRLADRLPENAPGDLYVDATCIDCGTCRRLAPDVFAHGEGVSFVTQQPRDAAAALRAYMALLACPVGAIGAAPRADLRPARDALPEAVAPGVLQCGYASERTAGAAAWLILRPEGNVLVDTPRFARPLVERIAALGGLRYVFLTRGAHLGEAEAFAQRFGADRVGHRAELDTRVDVAFDADMHLAEDLRVLCVPGQSAGSAALLWRDEVLFGGDLLAGDGYGGLVAEARHCAFSWEAQRRSVASLRGHAFTQVFPSHGLCWTGDAEARERALESLLASMQDTSAPQVPEPRGVRQRLPQTSHGGSGDGPRAKTSQKAGGRVDRGEAAGKGRRAARPAKATAPAASGAAPVRRGGAAPSSGTVEPSAASPNVGRAVVRRRAADPSAADRGSAVDPAAAHAARREEDATGTPADARPPSRRLPSLR